MKQNQTQLQRIVVNAPLYRHFPSLLRRVQRYFALLLVVMGGVLPLCLPVLTHSSPVMPVDFPIGTAAAPPVITNIQQTPSGATLGYGVEVNISCQVTSATSLLRVQLNWTAIPGKITPLIDMHNDSGSYWAVFTADLLGVTYAYQIVAENLDGITRSNWYNFTTIDRTPPTIIHTNNSEWVYPLAPYPWDDKFHITAKVYDEADGLPVWVMINCTSNDKMFNNATFWMPYNATTQRHEFSFGVVIGLEWLAYNIFTIDSQNNGRMTRRFSFTVDRAPPEVVSAPTITSIRYNDSVYIQANVTDQHPVTFVDFKWSLDWVTNYTIGMTNIGGDTWQTDSPIPPQLWNTTVYWEIRARDQGNYESRTQFSYQVGDFLCPQVANLTYPSTPAPHEPFPISVSLSEPVGASGLKRQLIYYALSSEGYAYHALPLTNQGGDLWTAAIPGQAGVTVRWYLYVEDNAGNNYTSPIQEYTVAADAGGIPFTPFTLVILAVIAGLALIPRRTKRDRELPPNPLFLYKRILQEGEI